MKHIWPPSPDCIRIAYSVITLHGLLTHIPAAYTTAACFVQALHVDGSRAGAEIEVSP